MGAYRALLHLFPASFRLEYGREMCAIFAGRRREAASALSLLVLWMETLADVVVNAVRAHADLLRQDLRYTARTLARSPGFTVTATLVAALGIGATTAAFSITDHVLLRPLPFAEARRLVTLWQNHTERGGRNELSPANYRDWKRMSTSFEAMATYRSLSLNLLGEGVPERLDGVSTTASLFPLLGVHPLLGRLFTEADDREGAPGTVLLSHGLWRGRFGGDPGVVGRKVILDGAPFVIIGVMGPEFRFPTRTTQVWTAIRFGENDFVDRSDTYIRALARLRPGVTMEQAQAEMRVVAAQLERAYPQDDAKVGATVGRLRDEMSPQARLLLIALFGAALCVLLIACTNLASLLLARGLFRRKELAVRAALGAGRERLVRQLLTESLVLAVGGGVLGVMLAAVALPLVSRLVPNGLPIAETPGLDLRILIFAGILTAATGIGFGVLPALRACRGADTNGLREGARGGIGGRRERLRSALVIAEVTASVVLLVSAGLLIRALWRVQAVDPGFQADGVLTLRTVLPLPQYQKTEDRAQFYARVLMEVRRLPGVSSAAYISFLPMVMRGGLFPVAMAGRPEEPGAARLASLRFVTPGFFDTLRIPLLRGRDVGESDTGTAPFVAVVSESFVKRYWPGQDPLGRHFEFGFQDRTVVGVVGDIRVRGLEQGSEPQVYLSHHQVPDGGIISYTPKDLVVRSTANPEGLIPALRAIISAAFPEQPISDVRRLSDVLTAETAPRAVQVRVLAGFAAIAVLLAGIGIHGLLAFTVSNRIQEIGVRIALGARSRDILALVVRQGLVLAGIGVAMGVVLAYAGGRAMESLLAGLSPRDTGSFLAAIALSLVMTLAGSLWPALRAVRVDPLTAIRAD